jgi:SagB-type dehydrogenase family enzyme
MNSCTIKLADLSALLYYGYGAKRSTNIAGFDRCSRVVPSAGALYPLEIYFHSPRIRGLPAGLFHYNPRQHRLRLLREGIGRKEISSLFVQPSIVQNATLVIFITGMFERSVFKYSDRGYRFTLLEAGHVAQNINLVATAVGLGCLNIGGFYDRETDAFLKLDGIAHSTIYVLAIGRKQP